MLETIGIVAGLGALAVLAVLALAARKPDTFEVRRSVNVKAPPDKIFPLISSLRAMNTWNPFIEPDPDIRLAYSGPESGRGAAHAWSGNSRVGEGRIEIVDSSAPSQVTLKLDMLKPIEGHNTVVFTLEPKGDTTTVTWAMAGRCRFISKVMDAVVGMDCMVGSQFEKGLAKLRTITET